MKKGRVQLHTGLAAIPSQGIKLVPTSLEICLELAGLAFSYTQLVDIEATIPP